MAQRSLREPSAASGAWRAMSRRQCTRARLPRVRRAWIRESGGRVPRASGARRQPRADRDPRRWHEPRGDAGVAPRLACDSARQRRDPKKLACRDPTPGGSRLLRTLPSRYRWTRLTFGAQARGGPSTGCTPMLCRLLASAPLTTRSPRPPAGASASRPRRSHSAPSACADLVPTAPAPASDRPLGGTHTAAPRTTPRRLLPPRRRNRARLLLIVLCGHDRLKLLPQPRTRSAHKQPARPAPLARPRRMPLRERETRVWHAKPTKMLEPRGRILVRRSERQPRLDERIPQLARQPNPGAPRIAAEQLLRPGIQSAGPLAIHKLRAKAEDLLRSDPRVRINDALFLHEQPVRRPVHHDAHPMSPAPVDIQTLDATAPRKQLLHVSRWDRRQLDLVVPVKLE